MYDQDKIRIVVNKLVDEMMVGNHTTVVNFCASMGDVGADLYEAAVQIYRIRAGLVPL